MGSSMPNATLAQHLIKMMVTLTVELSLITKVSLRFSYPQASIKGFFPVPFMRLENKHLA